MDKILTMYFSASGRLRRMAYFLYSLGIGLVYVVISLSLGGFIPEPESQAQVGGMQIMAVLLVLVFVIILTYASFVLMIKRLHDLDKSGWWSLLALIPFANIIIAIYLLFFKGTQGPNRFGPPQA